MSEGQTSARQPVSSINDPVSFDSLWKQWGVASLTLSEVREHYFPHIATDKHLRSQIRKGDIELRTFTLTKSRLECPRVTLTDLAEFLNRKATHASQRSIERMA